MAEPQRPPPLVLFVCVHNAGRSQMAAAFTRALGGDRVRVLSAGSAPGERVNPMAVEALAELGLTLDARPRRLTDEDLAAADVVVTLGCGDACVAKAGARREDWVVEDPAGKDLATVRRIRDELRGRVVALLASLVPSLSGSRLHAAEFFERQFRSSSASAPAALNPFEAMVLPLLTGDVLDLGCGLGALSLAAARRGCRVQALDASPTAVEHLERAAGAEGLPVRVRCVPIDSSLDLGGPYDAAVSIGLLMFFAREEAYALLARLENVVRPGGVLVLNVLLAGTTWREALDPGAHHLFEADELRAALTDWQTLRTEFHAFPAPGGTEKRFLTLVARRTTAQPHPEDSHA